MASTAQRGRGAGSREPHARRRPPCHAGSLHEPAGTSHCGGRPLRARWPERRRGPDARGVRPAGRGARAVRQRGRAAAGARRRDWRCRVGAHARWIPPGSGRRVGRPSGRAAAAHAGRERSRWRGRGGAHARGRRRSTARVRGTRHGTWAAAAPRTALAMAWRGGARRGSARRGGRWLSPWR